MAQKFFFHEPTKKSNLMVHALGKKYFLHKRFLRESPYFAQLIHEKKSKEIRLEITDQLITLASVDFAFCYVYQADVVLSNNVSEVAAILATAAFFKFEDLIKLASKKVMNLCHTNNNSFVLYNLVNILELKQWIFGYLQVNLMLMDRGSMKEIKVNTMKQLLLSKKFVVTSEIDLYRMLQKWFHDVRNTDMTQDEMNTIVDSIFPSLNISNLTQYPNIRGLKKDNLIPLKLIHEATDTNCEMIMRLMDDMESIPESKSRLLHRFGKVIFKTMGEQSWLGTDYRLGFSLKFSLSEKGLRMQKVKVHNIAFITRQTHKLSFTVQVFSLKSSNIRPLIDHNFIIDCTIPDLFILITTKDLKFPNNRYPLVISVKTTLLPN